MHSETETGERMEGEVKNFVMVWTAVMASLCYSHKIGKIFPVGGKSRFLAILPVNILFCFLPFNLTTIHLGGTSSFLLAWLANFKLLLFSFSDGPLSPDPPLSLPRFIAISCLPINIQQRLPPVKSFSSSKKSAYALNGYVKLMLFISLFRLYNYKEFLHKNVVLLLYCFHLYFSLEMILAMFAALARALVRAEIETQFDEPYLATSLQDFWGRRWNLMVSNILRPTVYNPVRSLLGHAVGPEWAPIPAIVASFLVSGLMHELIFYNIGRQPPTWEVTAFFLVHGVCLAAEVCLKKAAAGKLRLPAVVSGALTLGFVVATSFWLFFPPFLRGNADVKCCTESLAFIDSVKHRRLVSPDHVSCPYL